MGNPGKSGRSVEGFIPWKEPPSSNEEGRIHRRNVTKGSGKRKKGGGPTDSPTVAMPSPSGSVGPLPRTGSRRSTAPEGRVFSSSGRVPDNETGNPNGFIPPRSVWKEKDRRGSANARNAGSEQGERMWATENMSRPSSSAISFNRQETTIRHDFPHVEGGGRRGMDSPHVRSTSGRRSPSLVTSNSTQPHDAESPSSQDLQRRLGQRSTESGIEVPRNDYSEHFMSSGRRGQIRKSYEEEGNKSRGVIAATEEHGDDDDAEAYRNDVVSHSEPPTGRRVLNSSIHSDDPDDSGSDDNEEEEQGTEEWEERVRKRRNELALGSGLLYETESSKRRERRHVQAAREREGQQRRKERKKRNFLLVDEHTMKLYGVGVGDWRKELILMSRNLDPAIENINKQQEALLLEIAEWIQETWEYSSLVKFAFVKEVIARGVTLRRVELWKMIRNNDEKPDKLSDRSWKSLQRQMESPAAMRKSESCSRANASRVNFGRTGPSGEVGVLERLRKRLRRSPDPEEIAFEMARDKGYSGRSQAQKRKQKEKEGEVGNGGLLCDVPRKMVPSRNASSDGTEDNDGQDHEKNESPILNDEGGTSGGPCSTVGRGGAASMSAEEICEHPLVKSLMQRLEALEGRNIAPVYAPDIPVETGLRDVCADLGEEAEGAKNCDEESGGGKQQEGSGTTRRSGRKKKTV